MRRPDTGNRDGGDYFASHRFFEHRGDRPYDEEDPSTILHPNGTQMACEDRPLNAALVVALLASELERRERG